MPNSTDYTHLTKLAADTSIAVGAAGSETVVITSTGQITAPAGIVTPQGSLATSVTITALISTVGFVKLTGANGAAGSVATQLAGITAGKSGQQLIVYNSGSGTLSILHQSTKATTANRIITMTGSTVSTTAQGAAQFVYDGTANRWICIAVAT